MKMQHQLEASVSLMNLVAISNLHLQLSCSTDTIARAFPTFCVLLLESSIWYDLEMSKLRPERPNHLLTDIKVNVKKKKKTGSHPDNPIQDSIPSANMLCWLSCPRSPLISFMGWSHVVTKFFSLMYEKRVSCHPEVWILLTGHINGSC